MPLYEYLCTGCGRRIDVIHGIHASGPDQCEVCGAPLRKAIVAAAIVFKGSGWAKKDARDNEAQSARPADDGKVAATDSAGADSKAPDGGATSNSGPGQAASTAAPSIDSGGTSKATGSDSSKQRSADRQSADRQGAKRQGGAGRQGAGQDSTRQGAGQGSERSGSTGPSSSPATSRRDPRDG